MNNISNGRNNAEAQAAAAEPLNAGDTTTIRIDSGADTSTTTQQQRPLLLQDNSTSINMEGSGRDTSVSGGSDGGGSGGRSMQRNFLSLFTSNPSTSMQTQQQRGWSTEQPLFSGSAASGSGMLAGDADLYPQANSSAAFAQAAPNSQSARHTRTWRMNLNDVLSFSTAPSTEALRSLITHSGNFRYSPLSTSESTAAGDNIHLLLNQEPAQSLAETRRLAAYRILSETLREEAAVGANSANSQHQLNANSGMPVGSTSTTPPLPQPVASESILSNRQNESAAAPRPLSGGGGGGPGATNANRNAAPADVDEDNNVISDMFVKVLSHFVRYLPFICILFVKFIHDHLLGILDLVLLHGILYQINKSLREQIAKFSQKSYGILVRDFSLVGFVVAYRFVLAASMPDPFGLLIAPPSESVTIEVSSISRPGVVPVNEQSSASEVLSNYLSQLTAKPQPSISSSDPLGNTVTITKAISLGVLLYYVAVNDLIVKLITILIKISITMMPTKVIRHKPRARMYVLVEYVSQFYRALSPVRQWLMFLFESYSGLEVISGILFSSFYMGAKGFEFVERGKSLKKALMNFVRNMDYERKPTKDEMEAAGSLCPICHDTFSTPVVLECSHIFCDDCVSTWFKREQTCPMCRAKVSDDPTWQDGSTTFFYQLC